MSIFRYLCLVLTAGVSCPALTAHGSSDRDGTAVSQFDTRHRSHKVIAFLHPFYEQAIGFVPIGVYGSAVRPDGSKLFITGNGCREGPDQRGSYPFHTCVLTVIPIPESERPECRPL